ncbi:nuclear transport factor 2 family protein [Bacillus sp. RG28]|uniref:Nuclear transport factor 2 family protein n=1 Tax=Gottfriedia endophytica TaxID=2820819 RepID=A0A940NGE2_9BACI|nr:nuclear transport factor 2 family protein [Gottfriedia endophytica]MBP0723745.1 nuclear transport factor 2 family protein [Gottfriedia endophytica]
MLQANDNLKLVQKFFECYATGDLETMKSEILAEDVSWIIPGHHPLAGVKKGADEIVAYFATIAKANFKAEVITLSASEDHVVDVHRGWGEYGEHQVDMNWVLTYKIENGRIKEVHNFAADQHAADLFFWNVWGTELKPVPERLKNK